MTDGISWSDLNEDEQSAIVARIGLIQGLRLTSAAHQMQAVLVKETAAA